jgi:hypothetical protein
MLFNALLVCLPESRAYFYWDRLPYHSWLFSTKQMFPESYIARYVRSIDWTDLGIVNALASREPLSAVFAKTYLLKLVHPDSSSALRLQLFTVYDSIMYGYKTAPDEWVLPSSLVQALLVKVAQVPEFTDYMNAQEPSAEQCGCCRIRLSSPSTFHCIRCERDYCGEQCFSMHRLQMH